MPKLPVVSGTSLAKALMKHKGYAVRSRKGSHLSLIHRDLPPITIPLHQELKRGLLANILKITGLLPEDI